MIRKRLALVLLNLISGREVLTTTQYVQYIDRLFQQVEESITSNVAILKGTDHRNHVDGFFNGTIAFNSKLQQFSFFSVDSDISCCGSKFFYFNPFSWSEW